MQLYRFSPIKTEDELMKCIEHTHFACFELCKQSFGEYLPISGNIGIFCHYDSEYEFLTKVRKQLTEASDNFNQKYFRLHKPIIVLAKGDVPETTYTYLYIRKPDPYRFHTGDVDFVLEEEKFLDIKSKLKEGKKIKGARIFDRPDLDMIELYDSDIDALGYASPQFMNELVRLKQ